MTADRDITNEVRDGSPKGIANRLRYRLSERYPLGTVETEASVDGKQIHITLHAKNGDKSEHSFDYDKLKRAQDPLNEVLGDLPLPESLLDKKDLTTSKVEIGGKVVETTVPNAESEMTAPGGEAVITGSTANLTGADSAPDGVLTENVTTDPKTKPTAEQKKALAAAESGDGTASGKATKGVASEDAAEGKNADA